MYFEIETCWGMIWNETRLRADTRMLKNVAWLKMSHLREVQSVKMLLKF